MTKNITITAVRVERDGWCLCEGYDERKSIETYAGKIISPAPGIKLEVTGDYVTHPKYGKQFKVDASKLCENQTAQGLANYLGKADIRGVGTKLVQRIIDAFGDETINIIRNDWEKLCEVRGISKTKAALIHEGEKKRAPLLDLLSFEGITFKRAEAIFEKYGDKSADVVKNHTYDLVYDIDGIGFMTADKIALANGADPLGKERVAAAIAYCLIRSGDDGHCYGTMKDIYATMAEQKITPAVPFGIIEDVLNEEVKSGRIICDGDKYYLKKMYEIETRLAQNIAVLVESDKIPFDDEFIQKVIERNERLESIRCGNTFTYEPGQVNAVTTGLKNRISAITGGAGTGKTTIIRTIAKAFSDANPDKDVMLCAPTGKAAKRMEEATGRPSTTIHRMLLADRCKSGSLIVCDETSMIDLELADLLIKYAMKSEAQIVFVGDVNQLPPIGPGMFFRDLLNCEYVPKVSLTMCHRQAGNIALNADMVNRGFSPKALVYDNVTTRKIHTERSDAQETVLKEYMRLINIYGVENVCVISPMRKPNRSPTASGAINPVIESILNKNTKEPGCKFAPGDRVMNLKNDKQEDIYNGDIGVVTKCSSEQNEFNVEIDGKEHCFSLSKQDDFDLAYAMTVHKSQGSEYAAVIFAINTDSVYMMNRNLVYTAITRAKKEMVIAGETKALAMAIAKTDAKKRRTMLLERINAFVRTV